MNLQFVRRVLAGIAVLSSVAIAELSPTPVSINAELLKRTEAEIAAMWTGLDAERTSAKAAIDRAIADGVLQGSAKSEWLGAFKALDSSDGRAPNPAKTRVSRAGLGPQADALNKAWERYAREIERAFARSAELSEQLEYLLGQLFYKAAREAQMPSDLAVIDRLLGEWKKFHIDGYENRSVQSTRSACEKIAAAIRLVLTAAEKKDLPALAAAMKSGDDTLSGSISRLSFGSTESSFELLCGRIGEPMFKGLEEARAKVELLLVAEAPLEEIRPAMDDYETRFRIVQPVSRLITDSGIVSLADVYRSAAETAAQLKSEQVPQSARLKSLSNYSWKHRPSPDFQIYLDKLQTRLRAFENRRSVQEIDQRSEAFAKEQEALQRGAQQRAADDLNKLRQRIRDVNALPAMLAFEKEVLSRESGGNPVPGNTRLRFEVREIAKYWSEGASDSAPEFEKLRQAGDDLLANEVRALRERAMRAVISERVSLPQLTQPPLSGAPLFEGLEVIFTERANKGDWKGALPVLRVLANHEAPRPGVMTDRLAALNAFLVAQNLEAAGQYREAIDSYLVCVRTTTDLVPLAESAARIKALQAAHPETR